MLPQQLIIRKRSSEQLTEDEIRAFLDGYQVGDIEDYQMSAMLMAVFFQGLSLKELTVWTHVMVESGERLNHGLPHAVDKHSVGGVGDKTSFIVAPVAAALGCFVPMITGRALGHTGGTLDKLETIPGLMIPQTPQDIIRLTRAHGLCFAGQTEMTCPLDRKLYALRDVTGTVESKDLIAASIISKKISESLSALVVDIKHGSGAFMKTPDDARSLWRRMRHVAEASGLEIRGVISDMNQPLGEYFGLRPEIYEILTVLRGAGAEDLVALSVKLASLMVMSAGICPDVQSAREEVMRVIKNGEAYDKFCEIIAAQGGDVSTFDQPDFYLAAPTRVDIKSSQSGYLSAVDLEKLGYLYMDLGMGRKRMDQEVAPEIGAHVYVRIGQYVNAGDALLTCHVSEPMDASVQEEIRCSFIFTENPVQPPALIVEEF